MNAVQVAVIIVTWNVAELIEQALSSLLADLRTSGLTWRVLVVDSASSDATLERLRGMAEHGIELIASPENLGFARANNLALRHLGFGMSPAQNAAELPQAVYLLNPDTITQAGATKALYQALMSVPELGVVGAQLRFGDGSFQHGAFAFPDLRQLWAEFFPTPGRWLEGRFNGRYPRQAYASPQPFEVDFTLGATMMLRREVIQQTGMFDEQFFMYCEEVDWAWRIRKAGWRIWCVPSALVVHLGGQSTSKARARSTLNLWESRLKLFRKHYSAWRWWLARWMIQVGMWRKMRALAQDSAYTPEERHALRQSYQTIIHLARQR